MPYWEGTSLGGEGASTKAEGTTRIPGVKLRSLDWEGTSTKEEGATEMMEGKVRPLNAEGTIVFGGREGVSYAEVIAICAKERASVFAGKA